MADVDLLLTQYIQDLIPSDMYSLNLVKLHSFGKSSYTALNSQNAWIWRQMSGLKTSFIYL